jgi:tetratricopeptide (TPR) repeat protein
MNADGSGRRARRLPCGGGNPGSASDRPRSGRHAHGPLARAAAAALLVAGACSGEQRAVEDANRLLREGRTEEALAAYREALRHSPDVAVLHYGEGLALYQMKRYAEAEGPLRKAIELSPVEADPYLYLGHVLGRLGRMEEAAAAYREATRLAPIGPEAWKGLGLAEYNLKRYPEAREALEKYVTFAPRATDAAQINALVRSLPATSPPEE